MAALEEGGLFPGLGLSFGWELDSAHPSLELWG